MISSYHHLLKSKWLENKCNRRINHLIYILTQRMLPDYYQARHERQQVGLEGGDLEERHWLKILAHAKSILAKCITHLGNTTFGVACGGTTPKVKANLPSDSCLAATQS